MIQMLGRHKMWVRGGAGTSMTGSLGEGEGGGEGMTTVVQDYDASVNQSTWYKMYYKIYIMQWSKAKAKVQSRGCTPQ